MTNQFKVTCIIPPDGRHVDLRFNQSNVTLKMLKSLIPAPERFVYTRSGGQEATDALQDTDTFVFDQNGQAVCTLIKRERTDVPFPRILLCDITVASFEEITHILSQNGISHKYAQVNEWPISLEDLSFNLDTREKPTQALLMKVLLEGSAAQINWKEKFTVSQEKIQIGFLAGEEMFIATIKCQLKVNQQHSESQLILLPFVLTTFSISEDMGKYAAYLMAATCCSDRPVIVSVTNLQNDHAILFLHGQPVELRIIKLNCITTFLNILSSWIQFSTHSQHDSRLETINPWYQPRRLVRSLFNPVTGAASRSSSSSSTEISIFSSPESSPASFLPKLDPVIVDSYIEACPEQVIGRGRNGRVFIIMLNNKRVALKVCNISKNGCQIFKELLNEADFLRYLNMKSFKHSPRLITEGYFEHNLKHFYALVTDYIPIRPVKLGRLSNKDKQRCRDCLLSLHNLDIVHGDIRSHNFLVGDNTVFLIDYGFARIELSSLKKDSELIKLEFCLSDF